MSPKEDYSVETCITAGEFRKLGIHILASVPDFGWIPKSALLIKQRNHSRLSGHGAVMTLEICLTENFKWNEFLFLLEDDEDIDDDEATAIINKFEVKNGDSMLFFMRVTDPSKPKCRVEGFEYKFNSTLTLLSKIPNDRKTRA